MPVTFSPAKHSAKPFASVDQYTPARILEMACDQQYQKSDEILQSSFESPFPIRNIVPSSNSFVHTIREAYNQHRALVIRPDDVWLAILIQFSSFVNANAKALQSQFVCHQGKRELTVVFGDRHKVDFGRMASMMTGAIKENLLDPALCDWILPNFTTTTADDTTVCCIAMMATMKEYFSYKFQLLCGIPRVTLDGEKADWEKILARLEKLKGYGLQTIAWYHLLSPVIVQFIKAFDAPHDAKNLDFWRRVVHYESEGSGSTYLGGWITAFCVFDAKGRWLGKKIVVPKLSIKRKVRSIAWPSCSVVCIQC
jgi:hypothetical protein